MKTLKSGKEKIFFFEKKKDWQKQLSILVSKTKKASSLKKKVFLIICDRRLKNHPEIKNWLKSQLVYFVSAGEKLKQTENFHHHINKILNKADLTFLSGFISIGGGSVGDFAGFLASVYKRGVPLIHIPTTGLSAIDSAYGGKTALNTGKIKNILGSFYFPQAVFIIKPFFSSLTKTQLESAKGELLKIALIKGGKLYKDTLQLCQKEMLFSYLDLWSILPLAIFAKLDIVQKDPFEKKRIRRKLNFGHTLAHIIEPYFKLPHGTAVIYGMIFSINWSLKRYKIPVSFWQECSFLKQKRKKLSMFLRKIPKKTLIKLLLQDKKLLHQDAVDFVFFKKPGDVFIETVKVKEVLKEVKEQSFS